MDTEHDISDQEQQEDENSGVGLIAAIGGAVALLALAFFLTQQFWSAPAPATEGETAAPAANSQLAALEAEAAANPNSPEAHFELGNAYVEAGQWEDARAAYEQAIALNPNYQGAYANLGVVYYQLGDYDLAASQYEKALELDEEDAEVAYNLGALYLQQSLSAEAGTADQELLNRGIAQLQYASELAPNLAEPHFSLGVAYAVLNQREEAIAEFERFLELDTGQDPRATQEAQRYLEALRQQ